MSKYAADRLIRDLSTASIKARESLDCICAVWKTGDKVSSKTFSLCEAKEAIAYIEGIISVTTWTEKDDYWFHFSPVFVETSGLIALTALKATDYIHDDVKAKYFFDRRA